MRAVALHSLEKNAGEGTWGAGTHTNQTSRLPPKPYSSGPVPWLYHAPLHQGTLCVPGCYGEKTPKGHSHLQDNGDQGLLHRHLKHGLKNRHLPTFPSFFPVTPGPPDLRVGSVFQMPDDRRQSSWQGPVCRPGVRGNVRTGSDWAVAMDSETHPGVLGPGPVLTLVSSPPPGRKPPQDAGLTAITQSPQM